MKMQHAAADNHKEQVCLAVKCSDLAAKCPTEDE